MAVSVGLTIKELNNMADALGKVLNEKFIDRSIFKPMGAGMITGGVTNTALMVVGAVTVGRKVCSAVRNLYKKQKSK